MKYSLRWSATLMQSLVAMSLSLKLKNFIVCGHGRLMKTPLQMKIIHSDIFNTEVIVKLKYFHSFSVCRKTILKLQYVSWAFCMYSLTFMILTKLVWKRESSYQYFSCAFGSHVCFWMESVFLIFFVNMKKNKIYKCECWNFSPTSADVFNKN